MTRSLSQRMVLPLFLIILLLLLLVMTGNHACRSISLGQVIREEKLCLLLLMMMMMMQEVTLDSQRDLL